METTLNKTSWTHNFYVIHDYVTSQTLSCSVEWMWDGSLKDISSFRPNAKFTLTEAQVFKDILIKQFLKNGDETDFQIYQIKSRIVTKLKVKAIAVS